jgi:hypothetical protein
MKKSTLIFLAFFLITYDVSASNKFYLQNRLGDLIKIDIASAFVFKYPKLKGPRADEIPLEIDQAIFEKSYITNVKDKESVILLYKYYKLDNQTGKYKLLPEITDNVNKLKQIHAIFTKYNIAFTYQIKFTTDRFNNFVLPKITDQTEADFIKNVYAQKNNHHVLIFDTKDIEKLRFIFMYLNKDNEMPTGLDEHGAPSPHRFPRVFEAKTKSNFDVHFAWGIKFSPVKNSENVDIGYITLGFSLNLTNFIMPSLEFQLKYNFLIYGYPVEPYIGAALYGGFIDGFPIGLDVIGGVDVFPLYYEKRKDNKNFYLTGETRIGMVLYSRVYYDTGLDNEGIWKKLELLMEGGFYFGYGYIFNNYENETYNFH